MLSLQKNIWNYMISKKQDNIWKHLSWVYFAKFNTDISMLSLLKNIWNYNISIKHDGIQKHLSAVYSAKFDTKISILLLHKNDWNYNFSIKRKLFEIKLKWGIVSVKLITNISIQLKLQMF